MLDIIYNYLKDKEYYICLYPNNIYIYNYQDIISFKDNLVYIKINNIHIKIKGYSLSIKKINPKELLISGIISGISYE